jgi:truncated hemoglobin YjbI
MNLKNLNLTRITLGIVLAAAVQTTPAFAAHDSSVTEFPGFPKSIIEGLGGPEGLRHVINKFYADVEDDNRLNAVLFDGKSPELQDEQKKALLQTLLGTPTLPAGTRHDVIQKFTDTQYNALVEDLYDALEESRVSYHMSNRVMGELSAYAPSLVSAFLSAHPSVSGSGEVHVGPVEPQPQ